MTPLTARLHSILLIGLLCAMPMALADKITLQDDSWLATKEKRALLGFITQCALKKTQLLLSKEKDLRIEYYGQLGIAPSWNGSANSLTETQQRWISSCVFARVNYFGLPTPFNLRTAENSVLSTPINKRDIKQFPQFEGEFFGNLFASPQKKYVCQGSAPKAALVAKKRICSLSNIEGDKNISACGFVIAGSCTDPTSFHRDNTFYSERFQVWLKN